MKTKKDFTFNLIQKDTQAMIRKYRRPLILISVLTGFLLFFLNVFLAIAVSGNKFNTEMKSKLGVYIYLRDSFSDQQSEVLKIKSELENSGLKVQFSSKEQALKFVEKRVPDLITFAGTPATTLLSGISFVTTDPAPITHLVPI